MRHSDEMPFDFLARHVNQSVYTLQDWLTGLSLIFDHASKVGAKSDLDTMVSFAKECIEAAPSGTVPAPFAEVVQLRLNSLP